jgi:hypothetical protein
MNCCAGSNKKGADFISQFAFYENYECKCKASVVMMNTTRDKNGHFVVQKRTHLNSLPV